MYIEISEYFYLFDVNIIYFFEYINIGALTEDLKISWEINYLMVEEHLKSLLMKFLSIYDSQKSVKITKRMYFSHACEFRHIFNAKRRLWLEHKKFNLNMANFDLFINNIHVLIDHYYYRWITYELVLIREVLIDNIKSLRYTDVLAQVFEELIMCIDENHLKPSFISIFYTFFVIRLQDIFLYNNLFFIYIYICFFAVRILWNLLIILLFFFVYLYFYKYYIINYDYFVKLNNFTKVIAFFLYNFFSYIYRLRQKYSFRKEVKLNLVKYEFFRNIYYFLFFYDKCPLLLNTLIKFEKGYLYFFIIFLFFYIIKRKLIHIVYFIYYIFVFIYKFFFIFNYDFFIIEKVFGNMLGNVLRKSWKTYIFVYDYIIFNKRVKRSIELLKEKFEEFYNNGNRSSFIFKNRFISEDELFYTRDRIWDEISKQESMPEINSSISFILDVYYSSYFYLLFLKNKKQMFFDNFYNKLFISLDVKNDNFSLSGYYVEIYYDFIKYILNLFLNYKNIYFIIFHFYYIIYFILSLINFFLYDRELLKVLFFYKLSLFFIIIKNLYLNNTYYRLKKIYLLKDRLSYYLKLFYLFYIRYIFYYTFYYFPSRLLVFLFILMLFCLMLYDINVFYYFILCFLYLLKGIIILVNLLNSVNREQLLIYSWMEFKDYLNYIFMHDFIFEKFYFSVDHFILGKKNIIPILYKRLMIKIESLPTNDSWWMKYTGITVLYYLKKLIFMRSKMKMYLISYLSYIFIPLEYHLYLKSFIFWNFLYLSYIVEWIYIYGADCFYFIFKKSFFLFYYYYYFYSLKIIVKFIFCFLFLNCYSIIIFLIIKISFFVLIFYNSLFIRVDNINYLYYNYLIFFDIYELILFLVSLAYLFIQAEFLDHFTEGVNLLHYNILLDMGFFLKQYFILMLNWFDEFTFTHFYLAKSFKRKILPYFIVYKRSVTGGEPWLKFTDYYSYNNILYFISKGSLNLFNNRLFGIQSTWNVPIGLLLFSIYFFLFFGLISLLNFFFKGIFKDKNVLLPNTFFLWKNINEHNLYKFSGVEHKWTTNYKWSAIFFTAEHIEELDNPYSNMSVISIRKELHEILSLLVRRDFSKKKYSKFGVFYFYLDFYIRNRFFYVTKVINQMFDDNIIGYRSKLEYFEDFELPLKFNKHYSNKLLKYFKGFADNSRERTDAKREERMWYYYGLDYLLAKGNIIFNRLPRNYFIYLNKCYLLYMVNEEDKIDLVDYAFLDTQFFTSFSSLIGFDVSQYGKMPLRDAAVSRVKNAIYFEGDKHLNNKGLLKKVNLFFDWLDGIDNYFNNFFLFYSYDFKKDNGIMRTRMDFDQIKTIFLEKFYKNWEFYNFEDFDKYEGSDYFFQKEVFRKMRSGYSKDKGYPVLQMKEESNYLITFYVLFILAYFTVFYLCFYHSFKIYIKTHLLYEILVYLLIFIKCFSIRLFFFLASYRFFYIPKVTIIRVGFRSPSRLDYMYTITNGGHLNISEYRFFWIFFYLFYAKLCIKDYVYMYLSVNFIEIFVFVFLNLSIVYIIYVIIVVNGLFSKK